MRHFGTALVCSKNKGADMMRVTIQLICTFVLAYLQKAGFLMMKLICQVIFLSLCRIKFVCIGDAVCFLMHDLKTKFGLC